MFLLTGLGERGVAGVETSSRSESLSHSEPAMLRCTKWSVSSTSVPILSSEHMVLLLNALVLSLSLFKIVRKVKLWGFSANFSFLSMPAA